MDTTENSEETAPKPRRKRRTRRIVLTAIAVLLVLVVGGAFVLAWQVSDSAMKPDHQYYTHPDHSDVVLAVKHTGGGTSVVIGSPGKHTRRHGTFRMVWDGTEATVGDIIAESPGSVERPILGGPAPSTGATVDVTSVMMTDPKTSYGMDYSEVSVPTELGPAPAWYIPAAGPSASTWVIAVHGQNGRRNAMLATPILHRLGLPVLAITYRNDEGAPASADGLMHYGESEYRDVESAVRYAQGKGATKIVLYGGSMGGQIAGQFLARSPLATTVTATLLDSPLLSMPMVGEFTARQYGAPAPMTWLINQVIRWRTGVDMNQLDLINRPPATKPPTLLFAGASDSEAPVRMDRDFVEAARKNQWPVEYHEFPGAEHVESWNSDPVRYEQAITGFFGRTLAKTG
ncbi:alpha/beta hydrolase family protein [Amycolatopsis sp. NPDC059027]|uniref:alpha/beta hydrolase family protein n=1 Tax=Amycolatopsis sp. NPDC059027 TaxID=3346709 RepID=UPI00366ADE29